MSDQRFEYRVRWRRHSRTITVKTSLRADAETEKRQEPERTYSTLYQTEKAAREKAKRLVTFDVDKHTYADEGGYNPFDFPDLVGPPTVERRTVGGWEPA